MPRTNDETKLSLRKARAILSLAEQEMRPEEMRKLVLEAVKALRDACDSKDRT